MSNCCDRFVMIEGEEDSFETWQGLRGPYYTPSVSEDGTLSWTNNGGLQNPANINIKGPPGPGGVPGGTTGQLLAKASDEDFDTEWIDAPEMDAGHVSYDSTEAYDDGTVGKELTTINSALTSLQSVTEIIDTASGAIASFPDGSGLPMRSLLAQIEPVQDLHGYDAPWAGGAGKNLLDATQNEEGGIDSSGVEVEGRFRRSSNYIPIKPNTSYALWANNNWTVRLYWYDSNKTFISPRINGNTGTKAIGTSPSNAAYARWSIFNADAVITYEDVVTSQLQLEEGTDATAWSPYANECPITGWTGLSGERDGKNLLDRSNPDSPNTLVGTDGTIASNNNFDTWVFSHAGGFAISLTVTEATNNGRIVIMNADGTKDTSVTLPTTVGRGSATFSLADGQTAYISIRKSATDCQIETGSTASTYEAYTSLPITCTWQSEAGTVYGGTVDVVTGVLTVDWKTVTIDGTGGNGASLNNNIRVRYPIPDDSVVWSDASTKSGYVICDMFPEGTNAESGTGTVCFHLRANGSHEVVFGFGSSFPGVSTLAEAMEWITANKPVVCYKLAESVVYQLTGQQISTLLGNNTVFVDTGDVSVTYQASIKGYIDKVLAS